jgi:hypothetical protein
MSASIGGYERQQQDDEDYGQDAQQDDRFATLGERPTWSAHAAYCEHPETHATRDGHLECLDCHARWYPGEYMPPLPRQHAGW